VTWRQGRIQELPTIGGDPDGNALAINENGLMAGTSGDCSAFNPATYFNIQPVHAFLGERQGQRPRKPWVESQAELLWVLTTAGMWLAVRM
jgi:hypothetical protein